MHIQFDPDQRFQGEAIKAIVDLFDGQPRSAQDFSNIDVGARDGLWAGGGDTILGIANALQLSEDIVRENLRSVQLRNDIEAADSSLPPEGWEINDEPAGKRRLCPHFSVEMETGTGKTYVYLRTILELSKNYGFQKFIIVVPSVAIREGVVSSIELTKKHFAALYDNREIKPFVYDAKRVNQLRQFATSDTLQVCIINIQAFNKKENAVIYKEKDKSLGSVAPIKFAQAARPIVIIDEPQSVEGSEGGAGIAALKELNPLCTLRYSATHRNPYNLVYRLDPVRAFEEKLVKQIVVSSAAVEEAANGAFVRLVSVDAKRGIQAKLRIHVQESEGPKEKGVTIKQGSDLFALSKERASYSTGFEVSEISAEKGREYVRFANGRTLRVGEEIGGNRDDLQRAQIRDTIKRHLDKELQVLDRGIKVLSLFFIDRVANYRGDEGQKGKFALMFEVEFMKLSQDKHYESIPWLKEPLEKLHNGYFARDKKGSYKESRENSTKDDNDAFSLIMQDKERLLSIDEPLRFIFSHSALREGWDNPNVFQICTLNESSSPVKKRQEIGRGLRLPVDRDGLRIFDDSINRLTVVTNESYTDFARALQAEYETDCGVSFGKVPLSALAKLTRVIGESEQPIGMAEAKQLHQALVLIEMLDSDGRIQHAFTPNKGGFTLGLPASFSGLETAVVDLLSRYQLERHVVRERDERTNHIRKDMILTPEFKALWEKIKPRSTYRVEFDSDALVERTVTAMRDNERMERVVAPKVRISRGHLLIQKGGVSGEAESVSVEDTHTAPWAIPDILAYLQEQTELTRSTLVRILIDSGRLGEVFMNPQVFLDRAAKVIREEMHRMIIDGIKYEQLLPGDNESEWEMSLFKNEVLVNALETVQANNSVYEYVPYDSDVERRFAEKLRGRQDIKLFLKLPGWFFIDTPVGPYNPDWAIVFRDKKTLYLVRETKGTLDRMKLRNSEADKVRCGAKHFEALGVKYAVVTSADEVPSSDELE